MNKPTDLLTRSLTGLAIGSVVGLLLAYAPPFIFSIFLGLLLVTLLLGEWRPIVAQQRMHLFFWLTPLYPIVPLLLLILLNQEHHRLLYYIFGLTFANDTGSYIAGSLFGKRLLFPTISPKKTYEGLLGGVIFTHLALLLLVYLNAAHLHPKTALALSFATALCAALGDLFESWIKRKAGIKDSGRLLPGHGGLLDRFDSIITVTILFYLLRTQLVFLLT